MRLLHVTMGISPEGGGPTRSVKGLCRALDRAGEDVSLLVLHGNHPFEDRGNVNVIYASGGDAVRSRGTRDTTVMTQALDVRAYDIVHLHGLWDMGLHKVVRECRKWKVPYVISPRGMLDPWALGVKKWKKLLAMCLYQKNDLKHAAAFHATAEAEASHIRMLGFKQPIIIAPNGVDLPEVMPERTVGTHTAIFLSRLHPGKGLLTLAEAWARVKPVGWRMLVVGPDSYGHKKEVEARLEQLGIAEAWEFAEEMDDVAKWKAYRSADLLAHPSVSENFGITIAEGLAAELPVICTKGTPWSDVESRHCGWWIDLGVEPLVDALKEATAMSDEERRQMGANGRRLVAEKYTWGAVVKAMVDGYESVVSG